MKFIKMQGAGNDYVYVDCFTETPDDDYAQLAVRLADRHFGVGGDGLVLVQPSDVADGRMRMFNADGSESKMCGNAIRCVAKLLRDNGICAKNVVRIETGNGILTVERLKGDGGELYRVDMGEPILDAEKVPTKLTPTDGKTVIEAPLTVDGTQLKVTCVSMGNPHAVTFVEKIDDNLVLNIGKKVETNANFPNRVNAEFARIISKSEIEMRVWERGTGETLACGTGACATLVAAVLTERASPKATINLTGGKLEIEWDKKTNHVYMTGNAVEVFRGEI
ncbi:MAG: diaminopimelate epimerase [Planctomycetaceae bacterium]|jgi:diaminopimelate epimerase|nr:diaminopimelate epimerase [Planctomycetaceae bacterium]